MLSILVLRDRRTGHANAFILKQTKEKKTLSTFIMGNPETESTRQKMEGCL